MPRPAPAFGAGSATPVHAGMRTPAYPSATPMHPSMTPSHPGESTEGLSLCQSTAFYSKKFLCKSTTSSF